MLLHTKESIDFVMQAQLQRHTKLLLKTTYSLHDLSETTQTAYLEENNNEWLFWAGKGLHTSSEFSLFRACK